MADVIFRVLFIILFCGLTAIRSYYKIKHHAFVRRAQFRCEGWGIILFRWILGVPLHFATFVYIFLPGRFPLLSVPLPGLLRIAGFCFGVLCLILLQNTYASQYREYAEATPRFIPDLRVRNTKV